MGQFALGIRSLFIRLAIFFVMAALLAWALGGTLWPRAEIHDFQSVTFDGREWFWRLAVGGREPGSIGWMMMHRTSGEEPQPFDGRVWFDAAGPVVRSNAIAFAGRSGRSADDEWNFQIVPVEGELSERILPDRLAVEIALAEARSASAPDSEREEDG